MASSLTSGPCTPLLGSPSCRAARFPGTCQAPTALSGLRAASAALPGPESHRYLLLAVLAAGRVHIPAWLGQAEAAAPIIVSPFCGGLWVAPSGHSSSPSSLSRSPPPAGSLGGAPALSPVGTPKGSGLRITEAACWGHSSPGVGTPLIAHLDQTPIVLAVSFHPQTCHSCIKEAS